MLHRFGNTEHIYQTVKLYFYLMYYRSLWSRDSSQQNGGGRFGGNSGGGRGRFNGNGGGGRFGGNGGGAGRFGGNVSGGWGGGNKNKQPGGNLKKPVWDIASLSPFAKDFYNPHPNVVRRPFHEIENFLSSKEITIKGNAPKPIQFFEEANFPDYVMTEIRYVIFFYNI